MNGVMIIFLGMSHQLVVLISHDISDHVLFVEVDDYSAWRDYKSDFFSILNTVRFI